jgi:hypothetical protein
MSASGDLVIGKSGDRKPKRTAETRSRGEDQTLTAEARRHGESRGSIDFSDHPITCDHPITRSLYLCHPERVGANATASRRTPTKTVSEHSVSGSSYETANLTAETLRRGENQKSTTEAQRQGDRSGDLVIARDRVIGVAATSLRKTLQIIRAMLSEIFDESAYDRFLLRTHASRSIASYRTFSRERDADMLKKPRCC